MREVTIERNTNETQIELTLNLDGAGRYQVDTGCGFLNHMLELFARHGRFDLVLTCHGDVEVDYHHTTEDVGIALGQALAQALGDMRGIHRYGSFYLPMDEALILCAVDISGRCTPAPGDITIYVPWGNVAIFYKNGSRSNDLIRIGCAVFSHRIRSVVDKNNCKCTVCKIICKWQQWQSKAY